MYLPAPRADIFAALVDGGDIAVIADRLGGSVVILLLLEMLDRGRKVALARLGAYMLRYHGSAGAAFKALLRFFKPAPAEGAVPVLAVGIDHGAEQELLYPAEGIDIVDAEAEPGLAVRIDADDLVGVRFNPLIGAERDLIDRILADSQLERALSALDIEAKTSEGGIQIDILPIDLRLGVEFEVEMPRGENAKHGAIGEIILARRTLLGQEHLLDADLGEEFRERVKPAVILMRAEDIRLFERQLLCLSAAFLVDGHLQARYQRMLDRRQLFKATLDGEQIFVVIAQISRMELAERQKIRGVVLALEQVEAHFAVCIEHIAQCARIFRGKGKDEVDSFGENDVFVDGVVVILTDAHQLARDEGIALNIAPKLAVYRDMRERLAVDDAHRLGGQYLARIAQADDGERKYPLDRRQIGDNAVEYHFKQGKIYVLAERKEGKPRLHLAVELPVAHPALCRLGYRKVAVASFISHH